MEIRHNISESQFESYDENGALAGRLIYRKADTGALFATHTKINPQYEGKGYAGKLVDAIVNYAREEQLKVVPVCPYILRKFRDNPDKYSDVADIMENPPID